MRIKEKFKDGELYICKMNFPIGGKWWRIVGLGGEVQNAFYGLFGTDMLLLRDKEEVDNELKKVIKYLGR